jgi:hypothetical protein
MKMLVWLGLLMLLSGTLWACDITTPTQSIEMIQPGEKVGDFLIDKGEEGNFTYPFELECTSEGEDQNAVYTCRAKVGEVINISSGIYDDTGRGKLEEYWSTSDYKISIEGQPVDLASFGSIDYNDPSVGVIRFWNVVISTDKPGAISVEESGFVENNPFRYTSTITFFEP